MDAVGAQHLLRAIEQQQHWRQASAVREGRQSNRDPDLAHLVDFEGRSVATASVTATSSRSGYATAAGSDGVAAPPDFENQRLTDPAG